MIYLISFFAITWCSTTSANDVILNGLCENRIRGMDSFNKEAWMGEWYLYLVSDYDQIKGYDCIKLNYELAPNGNGKAKENYYNLAENIPAETDSIMIFDKSHYEASYVYEVLGATDPSATDLVRIVSADLNKFYIELSCKDVDGNCQCYVGVYTRKPEPESQTVAAINKTLREIRIKRSDVRSIIHGARCKY